MAEYYVTEERAMAPGISGDWPRIIPKPDNPNGRLVKFEGVDIDELLKQAKGLCLQINAEGGHGSVVHDMAKRVLEIIGDSSR